MGTTALVITGAVSSPMSVVIAVRRSVVTTVLAIVVATTVAPPIIGIVAVDRGLIDADRILIATKVISGHRTVRVVVVELSSSETAIRTVVARIAQMHARPIVIGMKPVPIEKWTSPASTGAVCIKTAKPNMAPIRSM
jgi:hypothetical protein